MADTPKQRIQFHSGKIAEFTALLAKAKSSGERAKLTGWIQDQQNSLERAKADLKKEKVNKRKSEANRAFANPKNYTNTTRM